MLLIYKPSNFITFNDLQDTCSITGQPVYLNYVGFQQTYSFPGHLSTTILVGLHTAYPFHSHSAPIFSLTSRQLTPLAVIFYTTPQQYIHDKTPRGILPLNSSHQISLSQEVTGSNSNSQTQKKPETIDFFKVSSLSS